MTVWNKIMMSVLKLKTVMNFFVRTTVFFFYYSRIITVHNNLRNIYTNKHNYKQGFMHNSLGEVHKNACPIACEACTRIHTQ